MKPFRRRAYVKACGLKLKRIKDEYYISSKLPVKICEKPEDSPGGRDDSVFNLVAATSKWARKSRKKWSRKK